MATKTQKAKVGGFAVASAVLIIGGLALITGYNTTAVSNYYIIYDESVLGLSEGAVVEFRGVPVGRVTSISVNDDNRIRVGIQVRDDIVTLRRGVQGSLVTASLATGVLYVSLEGGESNAPALPEGYEIPFKPSLIEEVREQFEQLVGSASSIFERIDASLEGLEDRSLADIVDDISSTANDARRAMVQIADTIEDFKPAVEETFEDVRVLTREVRSVAENTNDTIVAVRRQIETLQLAETEAKVQDALETVTRLGEDLGDNIAQLTTSLEETIEGVRFDADNSAFALQQGVEAMRETLESLRLLTDYLRRDPGALVRGRGEPLGD